MINWDYIHRHWDWAGHIVEALGIALVTLLIFRLALPWRIAWISALAFAAGHFHGREKRDHEIATSMPPPHLDAHYIWNWSWDGLTDFWPAALTCALLAILAARHLNKPKQ